MCVFLLRGFRCRSCKGSANARDFWTDVELLQSSGSLVFGRFEGTGFYFSLGLEPSLEALLHPRGLDFSATNRGKPLLMPGRLDPSVAALQGLLVDTRKR